MEDLKQALNAELSHVKTVWFDQHDNWYLHEVPTSIRSMSRDEILNDSEGIPEESKSKKSKK